MKSRFIAMAAVVMGFLMVGSASGMAAEAGSAARVSVPATEAGFVATQGRGFRRGGGGGRVVVRSRRRNVGRNVAIGVGAAVLGAAILSQGARASGGNSCRRWAYDCDYGSRQACRNFNRYC
jgi:hypothetical protein